MESDRTEYKREWSKWKYFLHRDEIIQKNTQYRQENLQKSIEYQRQYYQKNKDKISQERKERRRLIRESKPPKPPKPSKKKSFKKSRLPKEYFRYETTVEKESENSLPPISPYHKKRLLQTCPQGFFERSPTDNPFLVSFS